MSYLLKRIGLLFYGAISVIESLLNLSLYVSHLDSIIKPLDIAMPFYFWYTDKFLKGCYLANLKDKHG